MADKRFMIRQWEEIRKAGGISASIEEITDMLERSTDEVLTREEVIDKVRGYFNSCLKIVEDEETGELITTWRRNPTKSGLALALDIENQTLIDYVRGTNSSGQPYREDAYSHRRIKNTEFDILRKAYQVIESFYEENLAVNKNNAGVIYWLNNSTNTKWSNEQQFKFGVADGEVRPKPLSMENLPDMLIESKEHKVDESSVVCAIEDVLDDDSIFI